MHVPGGKTGFLHPEGLSDAQSTRPYGGDGGLFGDDLPRIGLLAEGLNVRPSSASKMVYQLRALGLVAFEKYGLIQPTEKGWSVGRWLLHRHEVLHRFFCMLNGSTDELELVEQVEHYLNEDTVRNLEALLERLEHGEG